MTALVQEECEVVAAGLLITDALTRLPVRESGTQPSDFIAAECERYFSVRRGLAALDEHDWPLPDRAGFAALSIDLRAWLGAGTPRRPRSRVGSSIRR